MSLADFFDKFMGDLQHTGIIEYVAVLSGIVSVWFSRKEHILVYPTGLLNTTFYIYLSFKGSLFGEAGVNLYYTVMSLYGWYIWTRKDRQHRPVIHVSFSDRQWWKNQWLFAIGMYIAIFSLLYILKKQFAPDAIPWADAFASATAFTGMWLMTRKKVESWYWWIATNIASIPLYFVKGYALTSVYYLVLLVMAVFGLVEWIKRAKASHD